jgi:hypothetical protein
MASTPLAHHPHHCPYLFNILKNLRVGTFFFGLSDHEDVVGSFEMLETLTPTESTTTFQSFIYFCAGIAQSIWWLGCRLDNQDLNLCGSQKSSSSPEAHPTSCSTGTTALYLGVNWPVSKTDHSPSSNAKVMNGWRNTSTTPVFLHSIYRNVTFFSYLFSYATSNTSSVTAYEYWTGKVVEGSRQGLYWFTSQYWHGPPVLGWDLILKPTKYKKDYWCECCIWWYS